MGSSLRREGVLRFAGTEWNYRLRNDAGQQVVDHTSPALLLIWREASPFVSSRQFIRAIEKAIDTIEDASPEHIQALAAIAIVKSL